MKKANDLFETANGFNIADFGVVLLDIGGTIYDNIGIFPGALDAMERMMNQGIRVILFPNTSRLPETIEKELEKYGCIRGTHYTAVRTSGGYARSLFGEFKDKLKVFVIGKPRLGTFYEDLFVLSDNAETADLVAIGPLHKSKNLVGEHLPYLQACFDAGLPMYCADPAMEIYDARRGCFFSGPGALAKAYLGDKVYLGKPGLGMFKYAVHDYIGDSFPKKNILIIGDELEADILGGLNFGIKTMVVETGYSAYKADQVKLSFENYVEVKGIIPDFYFKGFM